MSNQSDISLPAQNNLETLTENKQQSVNDKKLGIENTELEEAELEEAELEEA